MTYMLEPASAEIDRRLRKLASDQGYRLCKSRTRNHHSNDHGGYQIVDRFTNTVVGGVDYDLDPSGCEEQIRLLSGR